MNPISKRLLDALWADKKALSEFLSLMVLERIAIPWRKYSGPNTTWKLECLSILGKPIARIGYLKTKDGKKSFVSETYLPEKPAQDLLNLEDMNAWLKSLGWVLISLPKALPWESTNKGIEEWVRKTELGEVIAHLTKDSKSGFELWVPVLDSANKIETQSLKRAQMIADQQLKELLFPLDGDTTL